MEVSLPQNFKAATTLKRFYMNVTKEIWKKSKTNLFFKHVYLIFAFRDNMVLMFVPVQIYAHLLFYFLPM